MLKQYQEIKARHQDAILFFRLGDFYEMFFEDAKEASRILELVLTSRGQDATGKIPMCGIPFHAADNYIAKLIKAGKKIAICEQIEDPSVAKGIVKRDVIRIISAGTYLDDNPQSRYIAAIVPDNQNLFGLAFADTSSGHLSANQLNQTSLISFLAKMPVSECVFPENAEHTIKALLNHGLLKQKNIQLSAVADWTFNHDMARKNLLNHFKTSTLAGFGIEDLPLAQSASGALLEYLKSMHKQQLTHINRLHRYTQDDYLYLSPSSHYGLDIVSVLNTLDHTLTAMGKRLWRFWLYHPLKDIAAIKERQTAIHMLAAHPSIIQQLSSSEGLKHLGDIEKSISRLSSNVGSAKDLLTIRQALLRIPSVATTLKTIQHPLLTVADLNDLRLLLEQSINPDMPLGNPEGLIIRPGFNQELDQLRHLQENGRQWLCEFQAREIARTKINSLKVGFNNVFGYYIEITKANLTQAPRDYIRKQTLANAERFITQELKEYEDKTLTCRDEILRIEKRLVDQIQQQILQQSHALFKLCHQIASLDVLLSLSHLLNEQYIIPDVNDSTTIDIIDGRHPVVERFVTGDFIPNDIYLNTKDSRLIILTGPNMAGKSTYIRQCALLVMLAQVGAPIPATKAQIGVVDKIFTRIGANDDISKGQSTFMVEMTEAADIVNNLTPRSLIILDEIGRGTSTFDGLSLAWALAEELQEQRVRTLFATHFHELTNLAHQRDGIKNFNVAVREFKDTIIFMHKIIPGSTDDSYGIYVAKLAGIPDHIIKRSKTILAQLEQGNTSPLINTLHNAESKSSYNDDLFSTTYPSTLTDIADEIQTLDINQLTPLDALKKLNELKSKLGNEPISYNE